MARTPSHLISKSQSAPCGGAVTSVARIGSMAVGHGRRAGPFQFAWIDLGFLGWFGRRSSLRCALRRSGGGCGSGRALQRRLRSHRRLGPAPRRAAFPYTIGLARRLAFGLARRQIVRDLLLGAAGEHAGGVRLHVPTGHGELVALFEDEPLVALAAALHLHQREFAVELLPVQAEFEVAARDLIRAGRLADQLEGAAVPQHHAARPVIALGNVALEAAVIHGVILHMGGEVFQAGVERGAFGDRPGFQHAIDFQAEIVMQARGVVPLHTEIIGRAGGHGSRGRLRGVRKTTFGGVLLERHKSFYPLVYILSGIVVC